MEKYRYLNIWIFVDIQIFEYLCVIFWVLNICKSANIMILDYMQICKYSNICIWYSDPLSLLTVTIMVWNIQIFEYLNICKSTNIWIFEYMQIYKYLNICIWSSDYPPCPYWLWPSLCKIYIYSNIWIFEYLHICIYSNIQIFEYVWFRRNQSFSCIRLSPICPYFGVG